MIKEIHGYKVDGYVPKYPFAICDNDATVWPPSFRTCIRCGNTKLRYEGPITNLRIFDMKLDDSALDRNKYG